MLTPTAKAKLSSKAKAARCTLAVNGTGVMRVVWKPSAAFAAGDPGGSLPARHSGRCHPTTIDLRTLRGATTVTVPPVKRS